MDTQEEAEFTRNDRIILTLGLALVVAGISYRRTLEGPITTQETVEQIFQMQLMEEIFIAVLGMSLLASLIGLSLLILSRITVNPKLKKQQFGHILGVLAFPVNLWALWIFGILYRLEHLISF